MINEHKRNGIILEVSRDYEKDPPSSYVWHNGDDIKRFLDGHKIKKDGHEIDSRRTNFYRAEALFARMMGEKVKPLENVFGDLEGVAEFIEDIWSTAWWQRRYEKNRVHIKDGRGTYRAIAWHDGKMTLPRRTRNPLMILHELIHYTVPKPHAGHGRLFCARFKEIVGWYWDEEAEENLADAYRYFNAKWYPHNNIPEKYL